jgi:hypothetical protein
VIVNFKNPELIYDVNDDIVEWDIFLPKHKLVIEYHSEKYFSWNHIYGSPEPHKKKEAGKGIFGVYVYVLSEEKIDRKSWV